MGKIEERKRGKMDFDEYQKRAAKYDRFEKTTDLMAPGLLEKVMGVAGEAGEVADKFKKIIRDKDGKASEEDRQEIVKELGDVMWYLAGIARYMEVDFSEVAKRNLDKLEDRIQRGKIGGSGDNR